MVRVGYHVFTLYKMMQEYWIMMAEMLLQDSASESSAPGDAPSASKRRRLDIFWDKLLG